MDDLTKDVLLFVTVIFRHGNRAPANLEMNFLPNDTRPSDNFYPVGYEGLNNDGKENMYKLGKLLRKRYNNFLSDTYIPEDVEARSTDVPRTKMSLDLVLAGLYPPRNIQEWSQEVKWQPIPTIEKPVTEDALLLPFAATPQYLDEIDRVGKLPELITKAEGFRSLAKKLSNLIGKPVNSIRDLWLMYNALMALKSMNHELPEWADEIFPYGILFDAAVLQYEIYNYNDLLKQLNGGMLLRRIIDDAKTTIELDGSMTNKRKINLFSCHEVNIVGILSALGLYEPHVPEYSSAVIVELIKRDGVYYVKVIHYLGIPAEFEELEISDCETLCPLDNFIDLTKNVTPVNGEIDLTPKEKIAVRSIEDKLQWAKFE